MLGYIARPDPKKISMFPHRTSTLKNPGSTLLKRVSAFHASAAAPTDKFQLANKYHGLENNVW